MKAIVFLILFIIQFHNTEGQIPLYYKIKKVSGTIYENDNSKILITFISRRKLNIENCNDKNLDTFLRCLPLSKYGRKELRFLLSTSAKMTIKISENIGITFEDGKYRLIAGITGPHKNQNHTLIENKASKNLWTQFKRDPFIYVYCENTIEIYKGSLAYGNNRNVKLDKSNVTLIDRKTNEVINNFSLDTITIEPLMYPDLMYKNTKELYYFAGLHEIYHTHPENIKIDIIEKGNPEIPAMKLESKAFKFRKSINKRKLKIPVANMVLNSLRYYLSCDTYVPKTQCRVSLDTFYRDIRNAFNTKPLPVILKKIKNE